MRFDVKVVVGIRGHTLSHQFDTSTVPLLGREPECEQEVVAILSNCHESVGIKKIHRVRTAFPDLLVAQDIKLIPATDRLSKPAIFGYGLIGLISINFLAFFCSVIVGLRDAKHLSSEAESTEERERLEEAILVPTFQGQGSPPSFLARYLHIGVGVLLGVMEGQSSLSSFHS